MFFEDINFGVDGRLYAELVKNRSFEFEYSLVGWILFEDVIMDEEPCFSCNPHYVRITRKGLRTDSGLENHGFTGMKIKFEKLTLFFN